MPTDSQGNPVKIGDTVLIRAVVRSVEGEAGYNCTLTLPTVPEQDNDPNICINTKQLTVVESAPEPVAEE